MLESTRLSKSFLLVIFCVAVIAASGMRSSTSYHNSVAGNLNAPAPGVVNPLYLDLQVTGDTPGSFQSSIQYNNTKNVVGGDWTQTVVRSNIDGVPVAVGALKGTFSGGTILVNEDGSIRAVEGASLVIESGTGEYSSISSGSGNLTGNFDSFSPTRFNGTLGLNF